MNFLKFGVSQVSEIIPQQQLHDVIFIVLQDGFYYDFY